MGVAEENGETVASGKTQATILAARSESWFWLPFCAGTAGADCESGDDFAAQHGIFTPCWQHAGSGCCAHTGDGVCASRKGVPASTKLNMIANAAFTS